MEIKSDINKSSYASYIPFTCICSAIFTAAFIGISQNIFIDTDTAWLLQCLQRFTEGGTYTNNFFETNPPLSFLIYFPVLAFLNSDAATIKISLVLTFLGYALISNTISYLLLKKSNTSPHLIVTYMLAILFAQTWGMGIYSITRDALVFYCLIPLCIAQYSITKNTIQSKPLLIAAILIGGIGICLKPHYSLIPLAFFLHRFSVTNSAKTILASLDFITLFITGFIYSLIVYTIFPDYLNTIIPHVVSIYYRTPAMPLFNLAYFLILSLFSLLLVGFFKKETSYKNELSSIINVSIGLSFLCFFSYLAQGKGFFYQALPFLGFTAIALFLSISTILTTYVARKYTSIWMTHIALSILCIPLITGFTNDPHLTHTKFKKIEFFKKIDQLAPNRTYINYDFKPNYLALPYYFNLKNMSRFGILWPFDGLNHSYENAKTNKGKEEIKSKFSYFIDLLAEDIETGKPDVICIPRYPSANSNSEEQRLLPFLLKNKNYERAFSNYSLKESFVYEPKFNTNTKKIDNTNNITFDLYTRKSNTNNNDVIDENTIIPSEVKAP